MRHVFRWPIARDGDGWRVLTDDILAPSVVWMGGTLYRDDVASIRVDRSVAVVAIVMLEQLPGEERDEFVRRLEWSLR